MDGEWEFYIPSNGWGVALRCVASRRGLRVGRAGWAE